MCQWPEAEDSSAEENSASGPPISQEVPRPWELDGEVPRARGLRAACDKFRARFERVERLALDDGVDLLTADVDVLDALWDRVKASHG